MPAPSDTTGATASNITDEAIRIIAAAPEHGPLRPAEYAKALPPRAASLARVLVDEKIVATAKDYSTADISAGDAQRRFKRLGWTAAYTGFLAGVLGGVVLYLGSDASTEGLRSNLGLVQSVLLVASLVCAVRLFMRKPYRQWRVHRGDAEVKRLQIFALMMSYQSDAKDDEAPLLPLQLECFFRHLLQDQRRYFARKGWRQRLTVVVWRVVGFIALVLVLASVIPQLARLGAFGLLPEALRELIASLPLDQKHYALAGLVGGAAQGLLAALAVMSPTQRNAAKFREMRSLLDRYTNENLNAVRASAALGDREVVGEFAAQVTNDLAAEGREWLILQEVLSEMAPRRLMEQQRKVTL
jgi:hypothetical protein